MDLFTASEVLGLIGPTTRVSCFTHLVIFDGRIFLGMALWTEILTSFIAGIVVVVVCSLRPEALSLKGLDAIRNRYVHCLQNTQKPIQITFE